MLTHRKNRQGWLPRVILLGIISGVMFFVYDSLPEPTTTAAPTPTATRTVDVAPTATITPAISPTPSLTFTPPPTPTLLPAFSPDTTTATPFTRPTKPAFEPGKHNP